MADEYGGWNYRPGSPGYSASARGTSTGPVVATSPTQTRTTTTPTRTSTQSAAASAASAAAAEAASAMARAGNRSAAQAANLDGQIAALRHALETSFKQSLDQNLSDIGLLVSEQTAMLNSQALQRAGTFRAAAKSTGMATAGQAETSMSNLVRERADTMSSVLDQGAGQTDALRALASAARNWHQNAQEGNRAHFDTLQSINQSIVDLNLDTQTALGNVATQGETERERLWQDYYNRRSETFTQLGNLYTQQADYLEGAKEMKVGTGGGSKKGQAAEAFMNASKEAGLSYTKQGLPQWIVDYKGEPQVDARLTNTELSAAPRFERPERAQGATLRRWAA